MPVTAKLSRKFYETFGDEIATELVEWFNAVDATYRSELKEINELNLARFDAKLEEHAALDGRALGAHGDRSDRPAPQTLSGSPYRVARTTIATVPAIT